MVTLKGLELVNYQNKLYYIYRKFPKSQIKEGMINEVKDLWHCDVVLKKRNDDSDEMLLFMVEIPDAIIIEENVEN